METKKVEMTRSLTLLMALVSGISIASLYYIQPLEVLVAHELHVSESQVGMAPMLSQIGYALGLLCLVPLGDILKRKKLILTMLTLVGIVMVAVGLVKSFPLLMVLMVCVGLTSIIPQLVIPFAGQLAKPEERGSVLGTVTGGLLTGILLSRTFSGIVSSYLGWRAVYFIGAGLVVVVFLIVLFLFPDGEPVSSLSYGELMASLPRLFKTQAVIRESAYNGFFIFGAFQIFWSTLAFFMESPTYNMGSREVGYMGLVGVVGALASVYMGKLSDKKGARFGVGLGTLIIALSYIELFGLGTSLAGLVLGCILLDLGTQSAQVANQTRVQSLGDENRSRNNTIFMFAYFVGGATGSFLGAYAWQHGGWPAVCLTGFVYGLLGLIGHAVIFKKKR